MYFLLYDSIKRGSGLTFSQGLLCPLLLCLPPASFCTLSIQLLLLPLCAVPSSVDGLTDCMDPDCCIQSPCQNSPLCRGSRDPLQVIQQSQLPVQKVRSFYERVKMLVGRDSTHIIPAENPFNAR